MKFVLYLPIFSSTSVDDLFDETFPENSCTIRVSEKNTNESLSSFHETERFLGMFYGLKRINIILEYLELLYKQEDAENSRMNREENFNTTDTVETTRTEIAKNPYDIHCSDGLSVLNKNNKNLFDLIRKRENGIFISSEFQNLKNAFNIPCLCGLEEEIHRIIIDKKNSTKKKFDDCTEAVIKSLLSDEWNDIKTCTYFFKCKFIYDIIRNVCLNCRDNETENDSNINLRTLSRNKLAYRTVLINMMKTPDFILKEDTRSVFISFVFENIRSFTKGLFQKERFLKMKIIKTKNDDGGFSIITNEYKNTITPLKDQFIENYNPEHLINIKDMVYEVLLFYISSCLKVEPFLNLMIFLKSPFGIWDPVTENESTNHKFVNCNYEVLRNCEKIFFYKIYRLNQNGENKHLAVHVRAKIDVGFIWENGVIIEDLTIIEKNVHVKENTHIYARVVVKENSVIGKKCNILDCSHIYDFSLIEDNVVIFGSSHIGYDNKSKNTDLNKNSLDFIQKKAEDYKKNSREIQNKCTTPVVEKTIIGPNSVVYVSAKVHKKSKIPRDSIVIHESAIDYIFD